MYDRVNIYQTHYVELNVSFNFFSFFPSFTNKYFKRL